MIPDDEQLLERLFSGEIGRSDPQVVELFRRRPELAAEWADLDPLGARLDRAAITEREALASLVVSTDPQDRAKVLAARARARSQASGPTGASSTPPVAAPQRSGLRPALAVAAVVLLSLGGWWMWRASSPAKGPTFMGSSTSAPRDLRRSGREHRWSGPATAKSWEVVFYALADGQRSSAPLFARTVHDDAWLTLSEEDQTRLPDAGYVWEVRAYSAGGLLGSTQALEPAGWRSR